MRNYHFSQLFLLPFLLLACTSSQQQEHWDSMIDEIKTKYVPDSRVDQFNVTISEKGGILLLKGETTLAEAKKQLIDSLSVNYTTVLDSIEILPSENLGEEIFGLVNNSVSNIRSEPLHSSQLATQALLGMPLQILKKQGGWYYVRTPDDYLSWVDSGGIHRMDKSDYEEWKNAEKLIYLNTYGFAYKEASRHSEKISDLTAGNIVKLNNLSGGFYNVAYPDGRHAYIPADEAKPFNEWNEEISATRESLYETSKTMMGIPYLWGGTSTKGVDCSGFTKTIYFMNGMIIPRDASQQVHAGLMVDNEKNWDKLETGDLLFFGSPATENRSRRVVHVGMWIGDNQFIHASRRVRISSVDSTSQDFDAYNVGRYLEARRYLKNTEGNIIQTASMYDEFN